MSVTWNITSGTTTKTAAAWQLSRLTLTRSNQTPDILTALADGALVDSTPTFDYGDTITLKRDTTPYFHGVCIQIPRTGSPNSESLQYKFAGPWWHLENLIFQQRWTCYISTDTVPAKKWGYKSRVILGQKEPYWTEDDPPVLVTNGVLNSGQVITEILNYAIACGVPITIGTISPNITIPFDECLDITCAEAIRRVLRWTPDAVAWFDYSTTPATLNVTRRSSMTTLDLSLTQGAPNQTLDIVARDDIKLPAVIINYESISSITVADETSTYTNLAQDKYPTNSTGQELGALVMTVELAGSNTVMQKVTIQTEELPADLNDLTWWKARIPALAEPQITDLTITGAARKIHSADAADYTYRLVQGSIENWMTTKVDYERIEAKCSFTEVRVSDAGDVSSKKINQLISCKFVASNLQTDFSHGKTTRTFTRVTSIQTAEPQPTGLAEQIYDAVNILQYEGQFILVQEDVDGTARPGKALNITNATQTAWATMNATIHETSENIDEGRTNISFGPTKKLGPTDLIEYLRSNRARHTSLRWAAKGDADPFTPENTVEQNTYPATEETNVIAGETTELNVYQDTES
jgi:hypothetical protein